MSNQITPRRRQTGLNLKKKPKDKFSFLFDKIGFVIIVFAFILLTITITQYSQSEDPGELELASNGNIALLLALTGFVILFMVILSRSETLQFDFSFERYNFKEEGSNLILFGGLGFFAITITNFIILNVIAPGTGNVIIPRFEITQLDILFFSILIAIVEEVMFTFLFQITFAFLFNSRTIGIIARGIGFMIYHFAVYGTEPFLLISVLTTGLILAIIFDRTKRITIILIIHIGLNFIAWYITTGGVIN